MHLHIYTSWQEIEACVPKSVEGEIGEGGGGEADEGGKIKVKQHNEAGNTNGDVVVGDAGGGGEGGGGGGKGGGRETEVVADWRILLDSECVCMCCMCMYVCVCVCEYACV